LGAVTGPMRRGWKRMEKGEEVMQLF